MEGVNGGVSRWASPILRGFNPYKEGHPYDIKKIRPEALFPPPKPRAVFSARHPSKDVESPQPSMNRAPRGEDREDSWDRWVSYLYCPSSRFFDRVFLQCPSGRSSAGSSALRLACGAFPCGAFPCGAFPCGEILGSRERSKSQPLATIPRLGRGEHVRDCAQNDAPHRSKSLNPYRAG